MTADLSNPSGRPVEHPPTSAAPHYSLAALVLYMLKLGSIGFGGPVAPDSSSCGERAGTFFHLVAREGQS